MTKYGKHLDTQKITQKEQLPNRKDSVKNSAGGFSFKVDCFTQLKRFLILGTEGGSYYASEKKMTLDSATCVQICAKKDYRKTVDTIVEVSFSGRAPKNDPALFALAIVASGSQPSSGYALENLDKVARIGTHLFTFLEMVKEIELRGWGKSYRKAVSNWYNSKPADQLAYQLIKYQQRGNWSHRDALRKCHAVPSTDDHQILFHYVTKGPENNLVTLQEVPEKLQQVWAFEKAKTVENESELVKLILDHRLPHECVPNNFKKSPVVWEALLQSMPLGALVRNLGRLSSIGLLVTGSNATKKVNEMIVSEEAVKRARLHPLTTYSAQKVYESGCGLKGHLAWNPVTSVISALEKAFYLGFKTIEPTGKNTLLALDVSGSMSSPLAGIPGLSCAMGSAIMAMVTAKTEPNYEIVAFSDGRKTDCHNWTTPVQGRDKLSKLNITPEMKLSDVVNKISNLNFGGTDCALPMIWAQKQKETYESFAIYTDSETWAGDIHPSVALKNYRKNRSPGAKLAVVGMVANQFSIANPKDSGMLDIVGFDTSAPAVMADFFRD